MFRILLRRFFITFFLFSFLQKNFAQKENNDVYIINKPDSKFIEIRNGLLGLAIPKETTFDQKNPLAPIQSFIYKDGTYSDDSPNYLQSPTPPVSMKVTIITNTPQQCLIVINYIFNKIQFEYGPQKYKGGEAGPGYFKTTISLKKGGKTALIEEESDYDVHYDIKISNGLNPDKARYRGSQSSGVQYGYETPGLIYRAEGTRGYAMDATVDLNYSKPITYTPLVLWEPSGGENNSGRYWQVFNNAGNESANLFGFFQGKTSRLINGKIAGVALKTTPSAIGNNEKNMAEIEIFISRRGADNSFYPHKRFQWAVFVSTKKDLLDPKLCQPIATELNRASGLATRIDQYASKPLQLVPQFYQGAIYLSQKKIELLIQRVKKDPEFYKYQLGIDPYSKTILDNWRWPDSAKSYIKNIIEGANQLRQNYITGDGSYTAEYRYWTGARFFKSYATAISCLFADKTLIIPQQQKKQLEQFVAMMARIMWDDDNVPLFDSAAVNFGPANMPVMYRNNGRIFFALLAANDPEFAKRANDIGKNFEQDIESAIYPNGPSFGTPHYTQPTIEPTLLSMLQLKQAGVVDYFKKENRIKNFVDFYSSLLTPPSVRFSGNRKLISFGDGSEESAALFALLGAGFEDTDTLLSNSLYHIFENGPRRLSIFFSIALTTDISHDHPATFKTASSNYCGYLSHLRSGLNTNNETALWILNGDGFYDHRNDDAGEISIYALKAPLSLSRSCFYYPAVTDARMRSVVVPEDIFPEWNKSSQPVTQKSLTNRTWPSSDQSEFAVLGNSVISSSLMKMKDKEWYRRVVMISLKEDQPIILFYDSVNNSKPNIWSMPFMSEGGINTPVGIVIPTDKMYTNKDKFLQLPDATAEQKIVGGLNKFSFTGQNWSQKLHSTGGINWDLYTISNNPSSFIVSQWSNNWQNSAEVSEFQQTNGRPYSETQQILRIKSTTPFFHVLLPYFKGTSPYKNNVRLIGGDKINLPYNNGEITISENYYFYTSNDKIVFASFSSQPATEKNITINGGMAEIEIEGDTIKIRVHGNTSKRFFVLPFSLATADKNSTLQIDTKNNTTEIVIDYISKGIDKLSAEQGYTEYTFRKIKK
jgi:hypothetical protein